MGALANPRWPLWTLVLVTAALYAPTARFDFVHYDDPHYFYGPPQVRQGFTFGTLRWAVTNTDGDYWHPVGSIVHLLAFTVFPLDPGVQHCVTVGIFLAALAAWYAVLRGATVSPQVAFVAAALWAWHPLRVESVAWLTERGAVVAALFAVMSIRAYVRYARRPSIRRYALVALWFTFALLSKPTLPALPVALLAADAWPLGRLQSAWRERRWRGPARLLLEKVPLLLIALGVVILTLKLTSAPGHHRPRLSTIDRVLALPSGYGWFLVKTVLPTGLSVQHPWSNRWPPVLAVLSAGVLVAMTACVAWSRRAPLIAGWIWFLVMLLPMLAGAPLRASWVAGRYALLPHLLLVAGVVGAIRWTRAATVVVSGVLAMLVVASAVQLQHWRNSEALFAHALAVTRDNAIVHHNLGVALHEQGRVAEAAVHFRRAVEIDPDYLEAQVNLGAMLEIMGDRAGAEKHYRQAVRIDPADPDARANLDALLAGGAGGAGGAATSRRATEEAR